MALGVVEATLYSSCTRKSIPYLLRFAHALETQKTAKVLTLSCFHFRFRSCLVLGVLTGEVVPVLGALVRYKLPALIFIFAVLFSLTDFQKIQKQFPILKKFHP